MALINSVLSWLMKKRFHQIELFMKYPHEVQEELLKRLIGMARNTEWGKQYNYKSVTGVKEFRERVPVSDYEHFKPLINRLINGEQNLLWPTEIKWFAKSSGTTSDKSKFIPVSMEALEECHYKGGKDMLSVYCSNHPDSRIFDGKGLAMGGSQTIVEISQENYYIGDLSAIIVNNLPYWAEFIRVPKKSIALMEEWEAKIERMAQDTISHNVTNILGVPSWTLLLLRRILEITGKSKIHEVWPHLEVFFHGGVNFTPYRKQFETLMTGGKMNYFETYSASEGFFGLQDRIDSDDLLLMLDYGIYYEFIPVEQAGNENPAALGLDEVKTGENYAMVISTNAGLWRYIVGDTVVFTSLDPFRIKITGRTKNYINIAGEELMVDNAEKALATACRKCNVVISDYTVAPIISENENIAAHEWLIEFETQPPDIGYFTETLDNALKSLNSDYEAKRYHNMVLQMPVVRSLPPRTFYNWLKINNRLGGQYKVPRLYNSRKYAEEILTMLS